MAGFLLGLANGTSCLAFCAPVLVPYLVSEGQGVRQSVPLLGRFMLGRLFGYLAFGLLAGLVGSRIEGGQSHGAALGFAYVGLAVLLLVYGLRRTPLRAAQCAVGGRTAWLRGLGTRWPVLLPVLLGLATGISLCPPFALALAAAIESGSVIGSVWFFLTFFLGTSVFFLPLPGLGGLQRFETLRTVARLAAGVVGAYYLYRGIILVYGGLFRP